MNILKFFSHHLEFIISILITLISTRGITYWYFCRTLKDQAKASQNIIRELRIELKKIQKMRLLRILQTSYY